MARRSVLALAVAAALAPVFAAGAEPEPAADPELKQRCAAGELEACAGALQRLIAVREVPRVKAKLPALVTGCEQGKAADCSAAAQAYAFPDPAVQDLERAVRLARKACDQGASVGCLMLGVAYLEGRGVKADPAEAARLMKASCEEQRWNACWILGIQHWRGAGVARDAKLARSYFERACSQKLLIACVDLRRLAARERDEASLGPKGDIGADLDPAAVYPLPFQGELEYCRRNDLDACAQVAWHFLSGDAAAQAAPEAEVAVLLLEATCTHGSAYDCLDMAQRFEEGKGPVPRDAARAAAFYRKACEGGATKACEHVGVPK
jgi:TPR repeat protein